MIVEVGLQEVVLACLAFTIFLLGLLIPVAIVGEVRELRRRKGGVA